MDEKFIQDFLKANKQYRNSVFCSYFNDREKLLSLCNAVLDTNYSDPNELEINTLETTMLSNQKNDISCKIGNNFLVLIEHQSSVNKNMPFRCLSYITKLLDTLIDDKAKLYNETLIKFPKPKFFVFYDGNKEDEPLKYEMRLSDAFDGDPSSLELIVTSFNINYGLSQPLLEKCPYLQQYSILIGQIKLGLLNKLTLHEAIIQAVDYCIDNNVMKEYLIKHEKEVFNMLALQWKINDAKTAWQQEAREEGRLEGRLEGTFSTEIRNLKRLMKKMQISANEAMELLDVSESDKGKYIAALTNNSIKN